MSVLSVHNLIYNYSKGTPFQTGALNNFSFDFNEGEIIAIIGHTGSGKSTLLQCLNGLIKPESGDVLFDGVNIHSSKKTLIDCRFNVGLCFQYPEYQLFESTVFADVAFGPKNMGLDEAEIKNRVIEAINFVGIPENHLEKSPFELSGGEKRKVAIAGILSMKPKFLILDEPTAGLDPNGRRNLLNLILEYNKVTGSTVIFVSHSMDDVALVSDKVVVMNNGKAEISGTVYEVFSHCDKLISMGLDVPEVTRILFELKNSGIDVPTDLYTVQDAAKILSEYIKGRELHD